MSKTPLAVLALAAAAALAPAAAHAGGVSVAISTPEFGIRIGAPVFGPRVIAPVMVPAPVIVAPPRHIVHAPVVVAPVVVPQPVWVRPVVVAPRVHGPVVVHPRHGWTPPPRVIVRDHRGHGHRHDRGHRDVKRYAGPQHVVYAR